MMPPCEDGCNVPLYTPPDAPAQPVPNGDDFGGKVTSAPQPKLGDSSDKKVLLPTPNAAWPMPRLIEYVRANPFVTLHPGEAYLLIAHFERLMAGPPT